jgi:hypothetical protein
MAKTTNQKYQVDHGYIILPIQQKHHGPAWLEIEGNKLKRKDDLIVSLVALKNYTPQQADFLTKEFNEFAQKFPFALDQWEDEYYFVSREGRHSLIQMCQVCNLMDFYDHVNHQQHDFVLAKRPAHVTLYVSPDTMGIGINNQRDLDKYAEKIIDPFGYYSLVEDRNPRRK